MKNIPLIRYRKGRRMYVAAPAVNKFQFTKLAQRKELAGTLSRIHTELCKPEVNETCAIKGKQL